MQVAFTLYLIVLFPGGAPVVTKMPGHGGMHPSAGLQRTPHSCPKTVRGRLIHPH